MLRVTNLCGFGGAAARTDTLAPNITSASSTSVDALSHLAFNITTNENTTLAIGGTDAAQVELVSNALDQTHVLRWASNGTKSYDSPSDSDANNVYDITITATDASANVGTVQNFSITVNSIGHEWVDSFVSPQNAGVANVAGITQRQLVTGTALSQSGAYVRLIFEAATVISGYGPFTITSCYIGEQAASGDLYDMKATTPTPAQVLFGGSASVTCAAGATVTSDALNFAIDETKSYVISTHFDTPSGILGGFGISGVTAYSKSSVDEASMADVTGYSGTSGTTRGLKKIQVAAV